MLPAAVWALHAVYLAAEGLQCGLDPRVHRNYGGWIAVWQSLIFAELGRRRRTRVIILRASKEVVHSCHGRSWRTGRARGSRLSWRALLIYILFYWLFNTVYCSLTSSKNLVFDLCNKTIPLLQFLHWCHEFQEVPLVLAVQCILPFHEVQ